MILRTASNLQAMAKKQECTAAGVSSIDHACVGTCRYYRSKNINNLAHYFYECNSMSRALLLNQDFK